MVTTTYAGGRVYDPELGRFLSADPFVQDLTNLQAHNRYTYVLNNPLSLTDPTGFFFGVIFKAIGNIFKGAFEALDFVLKAVLRPLGVIFRKVPILGQIAQIAICAYGGPYACVAAAGAFSIATGGSLADAFQAAAIAAASIYVYGEVGDFLGDVLEGVDDLATKIAVKGSVHGVVGGAFNVARGGSFQTGFISGSIGAAAGGAVGESALAGIEGETGEYIRSAVVGIAGGAAAVATGGKFENGFVTAAFAHLWNQERTLREQRAQHARGVGEIVALYEELGYELLFPELGIGVERGVRVPDFETPRFYDALLVSPDDGTIIGLEVKTTSRERIYLSGDQLRKDLTVAELGGQVIIDPTRTVTRVAYEVASTCGVACVDVRVPQFFLGAIERGLIPFRQSLNDGFR